MTRTREEIEKWKANISAAKKGKPLSVEDRARVRKQFAELNARQVGENHPRWKQTNLSYAGIHKWLQRDFGSPTECQNSDCLEVSVSFQWAKLRNMKYERTRENYVMLCASCHQSYDKNNDFDVRIRDLLTKDQH